MELYHWEPNTFTLKAMIGLNEKGLDYASRYVDWTDFAQLGEGGHPALNLEAEHNPETEGPILVNGEAVISESFFLLEYLEDAFPGQGTKLKPGTPYGDWQVQVWGRFVGERAAPAVSTLGCKRYLAPLLKQKRINNPEQILDRMGTAERRAAWAEALGDTYTDEQIEESERKAGLLIERIEKALEKGDYLVEGTFSAADIDAFAMSNALPKLVPALANADEAPRFMAWLERMRARPSVRKALATSRTGKPDEAFTPGPEHARWG